MSGSKEVLDRADPDLLKFVASYTFRLYSGTMQRPCFKKASVLLLCQANNMAPSEREHDQNARTQNQFNQHGIWDSF